MKIFTFPKSEHLCLRSDIEALFAAPTKSAAVFPLRAVGRVVAFTPKDKKARVKVLLSVPKRKLRHAVDRNRAKRQLREAYRTRKFLLENALPEGKGLHLAFLWLADKPIPSQRVDESMRRLLMQFSESLPSLVK